MLALVPLFLLIAGPGPAAAAAASAAPIIVDGSHTSVEFDGHGGLSAGGTSRLYVLCCAERVSAASWPRAGRVRTGR